MTDNASNEDYFVIERSTDGTNYTDIAHPAAGSVTYTDNNGLLPNITYYYRIKAVAAAGVSIQYAGIKTPPIPTAPSLASRITPANGFQYVELVSGKVTQNGQAAVTQKIYRVFRYRSCQSY